MMRFKVLPLRSGWKESHMYTYDFMYTYESIDEGGIWGGIV